MHSKGRYLYSVLSLDVVCVVGICLVAWAWWLIFAGMLPLRAYIARGDSEKCTSQSFPCEYTYVLILLMVSIRGFEKAFPFFNAIQG